MFYYYCYIDRREFLEGLVAASIVGLLGLSAIQDLELYKLLGNNKATYIKNKLVNETEIVTITVTETASNFQAPQTYTETVTQTFTEYSNTTVTETVTPTQTSSTTTQPPQILEQILFGNSNMQFIPLEVKDAKIGGYNTHLSVYGYVTSMQLKIKLPVQYVSNGNINIGDPLSAVKEYN